MGEKMMKKFNKTYKQLLNELQGNWDDEYNKDPLEWRKKHGNKPYDWTNLDPKKWGHRKNLRSDKRPDENLNLGDLKRLERRVDRLLDIVMGAEDKFSNPNSGSGEEEHEFLNQKYQDFLTDVNALDDAVKKEYEEEYKEIFDKINKIDKILNSNKKSYKPQNSEEHANYEMGFGGFKYEKVKNSENNLYVAYDDSNYSGETIIYKIGDEKFDEVYFTFEEKSSDVTFNIYDTLDKINERTIKMIYPAIVDAWLNFINDADGRGAIIVYKDNTIDYVKIFKKLKEVAFPPVSWEEFPHTYIVYIGWEEGIKEYQ